MQNFSPRRTPTFRFCAIAALCAPILAACGSAGGLGATVDRAAFTSSEYGVAVSERVTSNPNPPRGGGRYQVGRPYTVRGQTYYPAENPNYSASGNASWYGSDFHGRRTANGEIFSANALSAAHPTLPLPSYVRVTNRANGRSIVVRVNDRGPYVSGRIIDLSHRAAHMLGYVNDGSASVDVQYVGRAPLEGDDTRTLLASYNGPAVEESGNTRVASAGSRSVVGMTTNFISGLFSYTDAQAASGTIDSAFDAANAMATQSSALGVDTGMPTSISLGIFDTTTSSVMVAEAFAVLGAVDEQTVTTASGSATHLTLVHLKPGVASQDVVDLARSLGLGDLVL